MEGNIKNSEMEKDINRNIHFGSGEGELLPTLDDIEGRDNANNGNPISIDVPLEARQSRPALPRISPSLCKNSLQMRILTVILMQGIGIISVNFEAHIICRDLLWNRVVEGQNAVDFPTSKPNKLNRTYIHYEEEGEELRKFFQKDPIFNRFLVEEQNVVDWKRKYIHFGEEGGELRKLLQRDTILPVMCILIVGLLLVTNIITLQAFDLKKKYLSLAAGIYAFLGASVMTVASIQIAFTEEYISNVYGTVMKTLIDGMPDDMNVIPDHLPEEEHVSVTFHAPFFLQVFESCKNGNTSKWMKQSDLMGYKHILIPSYRHLVGMGFCINNEMVICSLVIHLILTILCWVNVFLCLQIWRKNTILAKKQVAGGHGIDEKLKKEIAAFQQDERNMKVVHS